MTLGTVAFLGGAVGVVLLVAWLIFQNRRGAVLGRALLTGQFGDDPVQREFARWFAERPARMEQRREFVEFSVGVGVKPPRVAERMLAAIMREMKGDARFGDELAKVTERTISFAAPASPEQSEAQERVRQQLSEVAARLRALDG